MLDSCTVQRVEVDATRELVEGSDHVDVTRVCNTIAIFQFWLEIQ
jgi:hypothetical protein